MNVWIVPAPPHHTLIALTVNVLLQPTPRVSSPANLVWLFLTSSCHLTTILTLNSPEPDRKEGENLTERCNKDSYMQLALHSITDTVKYIVHTWMLSSYLNQSAFCARSRGITWRIISVRRFSFQGPCVGTSLMLSKPGYVDVTITTGVMSSVIDMSKIGKEYLHRHLRVLQKRK